MARRLFDLSFATVALAILSPLLALVALGVRVSAGAPILYRASRVGFGGRTFSMLKFRSMRLEPEDSRKKVSGAEDPRVFPLGRLIRRVKLDELPQLMNVVKGDMAMVGPRPEDPAIVALWYTDMDKETLQVRPGVTSPGSIYDYTCGERMIGNEDPEGDYVRGLLPIRLALDLVLIRRLTLGYELRVVGRTLLAILGMAVGIDRYPDPPEMEEALELVRADEPARRALEAERASSGGDSS
jgi:lipopolysaccharide/colanic/teichoic acid biosynthesis glycosyltransferase